MKETVTTSQSRASSNRLIFKFAILFVYLAILSYGLFFAERFGRTKEHGSYNFVPFHEIKRYINYAGTLRFEIVAINLIGNVVCFLPFGFLVASFFPENDKIHPLSITGLCVLFSALVEILQYFTGVGTADIDDVILNTIGGFLGYMGYLLWRLARYHTINRELEA